VGEGDPAPALRSLGRCRSGLPIRSLLRAGVGQALVYAGRAGQSPKPVQAGWTGSVAFVGFMRR